jgi:hypothetical protein
MRIFGTNESGEIVYLADSSALAPSTLYELKASGEGHFSFYPPLFARSKFIDWQANPSEPIRHHTVKIRHCYFYSGRRLIDECYLIDNPYEAELFAKTFGKNKEMTDKPWRAENGK